jgi:transcriptional regulator with XRE-family HTH domain
MDMDPKIIGETVFARRQQLGWSQERLAEEANTSQTTVDRIEKGNFKRSPSDLSKIATVLDIRFNGAAGGPAAIPPTPQDFLPVFTAAEGGPGEMVVSTDPIERVARPWYMRNVRDGYAVLVVGESMMPAFEPGDVAVVNSRLPPMRNKDMIFVANERAGEFTASIKRLISWTDKEWRVRQFNPPKGKKHEFTLSRKDWPKALRVVGKYYGG